MLLTHYYKEFAIMKLRKEKDTSTRYISKIDPKAEEKKTKLFCYSVKCFSEIH